MNDNRGGVMPLEGILPQAGELPLPVGPTPAVGFSPSSKQVQTANVQTFATSKKITIGPTPTVIFDQALAGTMTLEIIGASAIWIGFNDSFTIAQAYRFTLDDSPLTLPCMPIWGIIDNPIGDTFHVPSKIQINIINNQF